MNDRLRGIFFCILLCVFQFSQPASAATLTKIPGFGENPSNLEMHLYIPDNIGANAPVLVAVHYCTGSGPAFYQGSEFASLADQHGFIVIFPSAMRKGGCFDVASQAALTRDGGSDPVAIKSMLDYVLATQDTNPDEVYVLGISSGAMMTNVLLALYPEIFKAGVAFAGVPYSCFATTRESGWSNECADGEITKTADEWGDLVRNAFPGYSGPRPRIQVRHGTEDEGLSYVNFGEEVKQWTNVHGLDPTAAIIDTLKPGQTRSRYESPSGEVLVEAISLQGVSHNLPIDAQAAIRFLGLDKSGKLISQTARDDGTAGTEPTWRPFSDASPWNTPISPESAIDPKSAELIADFAGGGPLYINISEWSIPVYYVDSTNTPLHDVGDLRPGIYGKGFSPPRTIPIPDEAVASLPVGGDEHLAIVDTKLGQEWGMWHARVVEGRWMTGMGAVADLKGTGVAERWDQARREFDAHRARAAGFPLIAGLIRVDEIKAGYIPHALVFAYEYVRTEHLIPPASTAQASAPSTRNNRDGMPMGARIMLKPSFDVDASTLSPAAKTIARALQEYGAYLGDFAGANVLYAESSPAALEAWEDVLTSADLEQVFTPENIRRHFLLLDMGEVRRGQNYK